MPKLGHLAICVGTSFVRNRRGNITFWNLIESNNDHCVVEISAARFIYFDDSALIELEGSAASVEGHRERLQHQSVLHLLDITPDLLPFFDLPDDFVLVVLAFFAWCAGSTRSIRVVLF